MHSFHIDSKNFVLIICILVFICFSNPVAANKIYYLKDNLGSTRVVINESGTVIETYDYYPFGLQMPGRIMTSGASTKNLFTGNEHDDETRWDYFGARYYQASLGRFLSADPLKEKYPGLNPYHYVANNPLAFTDFNGEFINLNNVYAYDAREKSNLMVLIIADLKEQTGLDLYFDKKTMTLEYTKNKDGTAAISKNSKGESVGSQKARDLLISSIDNPIGVTALVEEHGRGSEAAVGGATFSIDPAQIADQILGTSSEFNNKTLGYGMVFMHELMHTVVGGSTDDGVNQFGETGTTVDRMNDIRTELGSDYGQRHSYVFKTTIIGARNVYLPFSKEALELLKGNIVPVRGIITISK